MEGTNLIYEMNFNYQDFRSSIVEEVSMFIKKRFNIWNFSNAEALLVSVF